MYNVDKAGNIPAITIGVINTNKQNAIKFDIRAWVNRFPDNMIYGIWITRPGETKAQSYPVMTDVIDGIMYWHVSFADTEKQGRGYASVRAVEPDAENGIYAKAFDVPIIVADSGVGDGTDVPIIEVPWAVEVMQAKEAAISAAEQAQEAVSHYPYIGVNGNWYVWDAEAEEFVDTGHPAQGEQGDQGAAGPQGEIGPQGPQGIQGNPGSDGQDGVSPAITVTEITGGHTVKITDAAHPDGQTFQVMDGEQGEKGEDGADAPQIDDTQASATNPYSGYHTSQLLSEKADLNQGASNAGKWMLIAPDGTMYPADLPYGSASAHGVVKTAGMGIAINAAGEIRTVKAADSLIDAKNSDYNPIVPTNLDRAVRAGLLSNAQITDADKPSILNTIGAETGLPYRMIEEISLEQDAKITRTKDTDGNNYSFTDVYIYAELGIGSAVTNYGRITLTFSDGTTIMNELGNMSVQTSLRYARMHTARQGNFVIFQREAWVSGGGNTSLAGRANTAYAFTGSKIVKIETDNTMPAGLLLKIYAR